MTSLHEKRSEETKQLILKAASKLFSQKGFDGVTIREIAKEAGCSHTTIYIYFKDKESLLHELSMPPLNRLYNQLETVLDNNDLSSEEKLKIISREFIYFCLQNKNVYSIFINEKSTRVDEVDPELEINRVRIAIFDILKKAIKGCLPPISKEQLLQFSRIYFFNIYGILSTYSYEHESVDELMNRLGATFDMSFEVLIKGFKIKLNETGESDES